MSMSGAYGPADDNKSIATLHRAFDLGINFLNTSASYGNGHNHELIAKALKGAARAHRHSLEVRQPRAPHATGMRSGSTPEYLPQKC
jgi:aryl-alcohol dehydrogenase-like predicted oxidoreductase